MPELQKEVERRYLTVGDASQELAYEPTSIVVGKFFTRFFSEQGYQTITQEEVQAEIELFVKKASKEEKKELLIILVQELNNQRGSFNIADNYMHEAVSEYSEEECQAQPEAEYLDILKKKMDNRIEVRQFYDRNVHFLQELLNQYGSINQD